MVLDKSCWDCFSRAFTVEVRPFLLIATGLKGTIPINAATPSLVRVSDDINQQKPRENDGELLLLLVLLLIPCWCVVFRVSREILVRIKQQHGWADRRLVRNSRARYDKKGGGKTGANFMNMSKSWSLSTWMESPQ